MKIAVFGGSFDPVHRGHLAVADAVHRELAPDRLLWVPARLAPHKQDAPPSSSAADRVALLRLALAGRAGEELCPLELERPAPSYTVDTLEALHFDHPEAHFFLVLGGDSQEHLPSWRRLERIQELAELLFFPRPGWECLRPGIPGRMLPMEPLEISASGIRARLRRGESVADSLLPEVEREILRRGLYRPRRPGA